MQVECCSGEPCKENEEDGVVLCPYECSDESMNPDGVPSSCHPHYNHYSLCFQKEKDMRQQFVEGTKDEMENLGGLLIEGKLMMEINDLYPKGRELQIFDRTSCDSKETCMRQLEKNLAAFTEEYAQKIERKKVEIEQTKQRYQLDSEDVCKTFGTDGFCETFKQVDVPTNFMLISKEDKLKADVAARWNPYQTWNLRKNNSKGYLLRSPHLTAGV